MTIATTEQLAAFLGRTFDAAEEAQAQAVLEVAEALLQTYCSGVSFEQVTDDVLTLHGQVPAVLHLPGGPVQSVSSVVLNGAPVDGYVLIGDTLLRSTFTEWPWTSADTDVLAITYTHGFAEAPQVLVAAELLVSARLMETPIGVRSEQLGAESVTYLSGDESLLSAAERGMLTSYRRTGAGTTVFR